MDISRDTEKRTRVYETLREIPLHAVVDFPFVLKVTKECQDMTAHDGKYSGAHCRELFSIHYD